MNELLYAKYNRTRNPIFQTGTEIISVDGNKYVRKKPLSEEAKAHIKAYDDKYRINMDIYRTLLPIKGEIEGDCIIFPFIKGETVKDKINSQRNNIETLCSAIKSVFANELSYKDDVICIFEKSDAFTEVFGDDFGYSGLAVTKSDIDVTFDNVIQYGDNYYLIDCEWTFDFKIPLKYIHYRRLYWYYHNEQAYFNGIISEYDFLEKFDISRQEVELFKKWEQSFQFYVYGENACYAYTAKYQKNIIDFKKVVKSCGNVERVIINKDKEYSDLLCEYQKLSEAKLELGREYQKLSEAKLELGREYQKLSEAKQESDNLSQRLSIEYQDLHNSYMEIINSKIWKLTNPIRILAAKMKKKEISNRRMWLSTKIRKLITVIKMVCKQPSLISYGLSYARKNGIKSLYSAIASIDNNKKVHNSASLIGEPLKEPYTGNILFSILMPVYNVDIKWLDMAIKSVEKQNYTNWELCIVDDYSTDERVAEYLTGICNEKIKIEFSDKNGGISVATNNAAKLATGSYILLMDNDDEMQPNALDAFYEEIMKSHPDILYSDQDIIDQSGNHRDPLLKPDWSPDLFLSQMYLGHLIAFRRELFTLVGGFRSEFNGAQDYDLLLRMISNTSNIVHVPKVLYSWRDIPSSTAANPGSKPYAQTAGLKAIQSYLDNRYGVGDATVFETDSLFLYDVRYRMKEQYKAAIIIPTKDHPELLKVAVDSIESETDYDNYEILILNNNSELEKTYEYFTNVQKQYSNVRVEDAMFEFNWSKLNNYGVSKIAADVYVFLNNDVKILSKEWLTRLVENSTRQEIGVVGGLLLYEDDTIQHAGVVVGMGGWAEHVFKAMTPIHRGTPFISPMVTRNVTAVTGACLAISKDTLEKIGPFDERFIICGSDIELGIRAHQKGFYNIYSPFVRLYHYESKSRSSYVPEIDFKMSYEVYTPYRENGDPFYNSNLDYYKFQPTIK